MGVQSGVSGANSAAQSGTTTCIRHLFPHLTAQVNDTLHALLTSTVTQAQATVVVAGAWDRLALLDLLDQQVGPAELADVSSSPEIMLQARPAHVPAKRTRSNWHCLGTFQPDNNMGQPVTHCAAA